MELTKNTLSKGMATALAAWNTKKPKIDLDSQAGNGKFKFKYASLSNIISKIGKPLDECGLAFTQIMNGGSLTTLLICKEDGSYLESTIELNLNGDPQNNGKLISYYKRYSLNAILGIAAEEDTDAPELKQTKPKMTAHLMDLAIGKIQKGEKDILQKSLDNLVLNAAQVRALVECELELADG